MNIIIWIFLSVLFIILELISSSFFLIWFGVGSLVATILNYFGFNIYIQFTAFIIISLILLLSTRKFADRITPEPRKKVASERLIGKNAKIIQKLDENNYIINVLGEEWSAYSEDYFNINDSVKVVGIDSIKLIIKKN